VAECGDEFGTSVAAGDINDDGYDDLVIGVPGDKVGTASGAGSIHIMYGSSAGLTATNDQLISGQPVLSARRIWHAR